MDFGLCQSGRDYVEYRGKLHKGNGEYDRNRYEGEFKDNMFHGKGIWKQMNGDWYYVEYHNSQLYIGLGITADCAVSVLIRLESVLERVNR